MSDTPETDALVEDMGMGCEMVDAWFARKLERERDEAIVSRKASAAEWLINVEQANARTTRALQQTVLAERERDEAREEAKRATYDAAQETIKVSTVKSHWIEACRERDEARDLAFRLYWAAFDLKRFARAYAQGYDEPDGVDGETKAEEAFYEASRNIAKILGFETEQHLTHTRQ